MARLNPVERRLERFMHEPPSVRNAASVIVIATTIVVVGAGIAISLLDRQEYPDIGVGMWWALQTVTTVGYGDVTPSHVTGRLLGAVVMLQGTAFIAIVTAVITSTFVARAERERTQGERIELEHVDRRFDEIERRLDRLANSSAGDR